MDSAIVERKIGRTLAAVTAIAFLLAVVIGRDSGLGWSASIEANRSVAVGTWDVISSGSYDTPTATPVPMGEPPSEPPTETPTPEPAIEMSPSIEPDAGGDSTD